MGNYAGRILIIEDDPDMAALLVNILTLDGFLCEHIAKLTDLVDILKDFSYDAVILDLYLGMESGLEAIPIICRESPFTKVIVLTGESSIDIAVEAMERGATTYLKKTDDLKLISAEVKRRLKKPARLHTASPSQRAELGLIGRSSALMELWKTLERIRDVDATILLSGESGTGKEVVARAIHQLSSRHDEPFEAINCGAIPTELLESELFGYKKGAFTDARQDRKGMFEYCEHGYLFLDEISEMPLSLQVKILRVLQEREIKPVGSAQSKPIDTRVVCATNRDLETETRAGRFREDLYYRLSVIELEIPPLRERAEDIEPILKYYLDQFNARYRKSVAFPQRSVMARLESYSWPGNVRELRNSVERAVILAEDDQLDLKFIFPHRRKGGRCQGQPIDNLNYIEAKEAFEQDFLERLLTVARGNISKAARISGRFRSDIYRLVEKYKVDLTSFKNGD